MVAFLDLHNSEQCLEATFQIHEKFMQIVMYMFKFLTSSDSHLMGFC